MVSGGTKRSTSGPACKQQQAVRGGVVEHLTCAAPEPLGQHRTDHQAAAAHLGEQIQLLVDPGQRLAQVVGLALHVRSARAGEASCASATRATAAAIGLPPNVVPCAPNCMISATRGPASIAPIGKPQPSALARVTISGTYLVLGMREQRAGATHAALDLVQHQQRIVLHRTSARTRARNPGAAGSTPPSPCTGSSITAATSPAANAASSAATSLKSR